MDFTEYFPIWEQLTGTQRDRISSAVMHKSVEKGTMLHCGNTHCTGLLLVEHGQLRAYLLSDEGRELTIYRLFDRDLCLFSASCIMHSIQFDVMVEAEQDTSFWIVPADVYQEVMQTSAPLANFTNEIMATRFSEVIWLMETILWKSFDKRLAEFLIDESVVEQSAVLTMTHETIARHLGTAREVVTRMLRYFQSEGMVKLSRGRIELMNTDRLIHLQNE